MKLLFITALALAATRFHEKPDDAAFGAIQKGLDTAIDGQKNIIAEQKALKDQVTQNVEHWQKENKKLAEEFTLFKNSSSDNVAELEKKLAGMRLAADRELRLAKGSGSLADRIAPECKMLLNASIRERAHRAGANVPLTAEMKALTGASSPGSLELQDKLAQNVYDLLPEYGIWNTLGTEPISARNNLLSVDTADPIAYVIAEGGTIADDTNIAGSQVTAVAKKIAVLLKVSNELLMDAEYDITPKLLRKFLRAISYRLDYLAFMADGTDDATHGAFTGVFNFATNKAAATGNTTMETLDFEDITGLMLTPGVQCLSRQSRWWMHPHILVRMLHIKDSNGRPIFLSALEAPTAGAMGSILGFPVTLGNVLPTTNTAGSKVMAFGDPDAFVVGLRKDVEIVSSEHYAFNSDQHTFRGIARAAVKGRLATGLARLTLAAS